MLNQRINTSLLSLKPFTEITHFISRKWARQEPCSSFRHVSILHGFFLAQIFILLMFLTDGIIFIIISTPWKEFNQFAKGSKCLFIMISIEIDHAGDLEISKYSWLAPALNQCSPTDSHSDTTWSYSSPCFWTSKWSIDHNNTDSKLAEPTSEVRAVKHYFGFI